MGELRKPQAKLPGNINFLHAILEDYQPRLFQQLTE
jgi:hypothetical protein